MPRLLSLVLVFLAAPALGQSVLLQQLGSPDPTSNGRFGSALALGGDFAVIGEPGDFGAVGRAYAYLRDPGSGTWALDAELLPDGLETGGEFDPVFGSAVAFDGANALVGAPYESSEVVNSGAAYVFRRDEETTEWMSFAELKAPEPEIEAQFGVAVALSGATAVVGAPTDDGAGTNAGAAYVYTRDTESGTWLFDQRLVAEDAGEGDRFGFSVSVAGDVLVVGVASGTSALDPGVAYVFQRDGDGPWTQVQQLVPDDLAPGDAFGSTVSTDGETLLVGAPFSGAAEQGSAYVYEPTGPESAPWELALRLISNAPQEGAQFGASVAVDGAHAVVGAPLDGTGAERGAVYPFERVNGVWNTTGRIGAPVEDANTGFGLFAALSADLTLVSAPGADGEATDEGAAFIYSLAPTSSEEAVAPDAFSFEAPYPNPVRTTVELTYVLGASAPVSLVVYDLLGREVAVLERGIRSAGRHTARWDASTLGPGLYLVRLTADDQTATRKLVKQ